MNNLKENKNLKSIEKMSNSKNLSNFKENNLPIIKSNSNLSTKLNNVAIVKPNNFKAESSKLPPTCTKYLTPLNTKNTNKRPLDSNNSELTKSNKMAKLLEGIDWNLPIEDETKINSTFNSTFNTTFGRTINDNSTKNVKNKINNLTSGKAIYNNSIDKIKDNKINVTFNTTFNTTFDNSSIEQFKDQSYNDYLDLDLLNGLSDCEFDDNEELDYKDVKFEGFYGLPDGIRRILKERRNIDKPYEWQDTLLRKLISHNHNLVYCVPTSGGKTLVAELMILREILLKKKNALFVFPYVSIVQEKLRSLMPFSLDSNLGFIIEEYANDKGTIPPKKRRYKNTLYIATIEKAHLLLTCLLEEKRLDEIGLIVVDELHMLGDGTIRGTTLESFLLTCMLAKQMKHFNARLIAMSATLNNFEQIKKFLNCKIEERNFRPVELIEYIKFNQKIYKYIGDKGAENEVFIEERTLKRKIVKTDPDNLTELVDECMPDSPVLIFCPTKKQCESVVNLLCNHLPASNKEFKKKERKQILDDLVDASVGKVCPVLKFGVPFGIVYHHSGLTTDEREIIESSFLDGNLNVIVCTSTLAAGVNLPAQRVIIRAPYVARDFITSSQYKQMVGRAGRAGLCTKPGESILMIRDVDKDQVKPLFVDVQNDCISSIRNNKEAGISRIFLTLIHLGLVNNLGQIRNILSNQTLYGIQFSNEESFMSLLDDFLARFYELNLINKPSDDQEQIIITSLGKGAVKGLIDINKCNRLYNDLKKLSSKVSVNSTFHLFYICTYVFDLEELPQKPDATYLQETFFKLSEQEKNDAALMGIDESEINRYFLYNGSSSEKIRRFFFALIIYESFKSGENSLYSMSNKCKIQRGTLQQLFNRFSTNSLSLLRFVEEIEDLWGLKSLLQQICSDLSLCANPLLMPLLQIPNVKIGRAKQLYAGNYKTMEDIAKATSTDLIKCLNKVSRKICDDIIAFVKQSFKDRADCLKAETEYYSQLGN